MRNQKGITLVALVITIIVLLILAGVSISLVVGQNGVLTRATEAVSAQKAAEVKQAISLAVNSCDAYWGSKWATNSSYTREMAYNDASNGLIVEMGKQGYTLAAVTLSTDVDTFQTWTITTETEKFTVEVALTSTGKLKFGEVKQTTI